MPKTWNSPQRRRERRDYAENTKSLFASLRFLCALCVSAVNILFLLLPLLLHAQSPCDNTPAYSPCEFVFELSGQAAADHPNPYATADLKAEFRGPRHKTY